MKSILFKCCVFIFIAFSFAAAVHPVFMTVTDIAHNEKEKTLEVSCKIFTDDFEKTLRAAYKTKVDLQDEKLKPAMDKLVNDYVQRHLKVSVDDKPIALKYIGFEISEEAVMSYFEGSNVNTAKKVTVMDDLLFEYKKEQISLLHITVGGERKSTKLSAPETSAVIKF